MPPPHHTPRLDPDASNSPQRRPQLSRAPHVHRPPKASRFLVAALYIPPKFSPVENNTNQPKKLGLGFPQSEIEMVARRTPPSRPPNPALPYREDCWSEGETSVLIDAWGDRYVELNRGNLRQKQWQEVADAVNSRPCDARRPPRTDVQCKNRIDTLKKKYKSERSKIAGGSSQWVFYDRLDDLIGALQNPNPPLLALPPPPVTSPPLALPLPANRKGFPLPTASVVEDPYYKRRHSPDHDDESESSLSRPVNLHRKPPSRSGKRLRRAKEEVEDDDGIALLSKAILRLGEVYEKVEVEKNKQMMELEKQRMEFAKSMEVQRMQMFVDAQVEIMKMERRGKHGGRRGAVENRGSDVLPFLLQPVLL